MPPQWLQFTSSQTDKLKATLFYKYTVRHWISITLLLQGKSMMARLQKRRRWTKAEDRRLSECKSRNPHLSWPDIAMRAELQRSGKSCGERWYNHLNPDVKRGIFSQEEDDTIIHLQSLHGNKWATIAKQPLLRGRSPNAIKNRWNNYLKQKVATSTDHENIADPQSSTGDQPHATQLFHLNHNIPNASSSSIPTLVSASQGIANLWSTSEANLAGFHRGYFRSDDGTIHHPFGGDDFAGFDNSLNPNGSSNETNFAGNCFGDSDFWTGFTLTGEGVHAN